MKFERKLITEFTDLDLVISTSDGNSHSRITKFYPEYYLIVQKGTDYLRKLLRELEREKRIELDIVGK